ncbi:hypothetical protein BS78_03G210700 [Paspalum vaginatum]|nr:hypothetical protein BS78_03G210700 [Paspalum vaginatum]KAJ1284523.1 hypothetical protein BS78_03G210700 [Paspalum vaginatum]KAJ1284524.1 hypothetical protein BS78_03G210700 [Paspalum vaginatum]KAJ1284525.1 hypothetical protein BS78_03G210700 [Paspalum vaginatum]KAJ1284526.1 hypothetical protein BS78_03G210700 [Paspalum vaginatum]
MYKALRPNWGEKKRKVKHIKGHPLILRSALEKEPNRHSKAAVPSLSLPPLLFPIRKLPSSQKHSNRHLHGRSRLTGRDADPQAVTSPLSLGACHRTSGRMPPPPCTWTAAMWKSWSVSACGPDVIR